MSNPNFSGGDKFYIDVEEVKKVLQELDRVCRNLLTNHEQSKTLHEAKAMTEQNGDVSSALKTAKGNLESLDRSNEVNRRLPESGSSDRRRSSVLKGLRKNLEETMDSFSRVKEIISTEYRETIQKRYFTVTGENPDEDTVDRLISTGESETFLQKAIQEQGRGQILDTINEIEERHDAVKDIEKSLNELHQVLIVEHQSALLDDIEADVKRFHSMVRSATDELAKARLHRENRRKWTSFAILLLVIIVARYFHLYNFLRLCFQII